MQGGLNFHEEEQTIDMCIKCMAVLTFMKRWKLSICVLNAGRFLKEGFYQHDHTFVHMYKGTFFNQFSDQDLKLLRKCVVYTTRVQICIKLSACVSLYLRQMLYFVK